ncbi:MAG TPA: hypothetical protein VMG09_00675 [Bacteroidota bacterium]|nr:hypothetical protein [Bacteroidota bacterium]
MAIVRYLLGGCRTSFTLRAIAAVVYVAVAVIAIVPAASFRSSFDAALGATVARDVLNNGFSFTVVGDLLRNHGKELSASLGSLVPSLALWLIVNLFFSGGVIFAAGAGECTVQEFFQKCARFMGRLFRLMLLIGIVALLALLGVSIVLSVVNEVITNGALSEDPGFWAFGVDIAVIAIVALLVLLVDEYAKIALVVEDEPSALRGLRESLIFLWSSKLAVVGLTLLILVVFLVLTAVYLGVASVLDSSAILAAGGLFVLQQLLVASRVLLRIAGFGAETALYQDKRWEQQYRLGRGGMGAIIDID